MDNRYSSARSNYVFRGFTDYSAGEKENSFYFQKRCGKIDWKKIAAIDVDNFEREYNISVLQDNIDNFVFCCIETEIDVKSVSPVFVKLFKVGQLIAEYLLHTQDHLVSIIEKMRQKSPKPGNELLKERNEYNIANDNSHSQRKSKKTNKNPIVEQVSGGVYCSFCGKIFASSTYLIRHVLRRHQVELSTGIKTVSNQNEVAPQSDVHASETLLTDLVVKQTDDLKQFLENVKSEIKQQMDVMVDSLNEKNKKWDETAIVHRIGNWKQEEEIKWKTQLGGMKAEFTEELQKLRLKVIDSERTIENVEEKCIIAVETFKKDILQVTATATDDLLKEHQNELLKIRSELDNQLAASHEVFLSKLNDQDLQLKSRMAEICHQNEINFHSFKVSMEATVSQLNSSQNVSDLEKKLESYLKLLCATSQHKAHKKHKLVSKQKEHLRQSHKNSAQSTVLFRQNDSLLRASSRTFEVTSKEVTVANLPDSIVDSTHNRPCKSEQHLKTENCKWVDDFKVTKVQGLHGSSKAGGHPKNKVSETSFKVKSSTVEENPKVSESLEFMSTERKKREQSQSNNDKKISKEYKILDPDGHTRQIDELENKVDHVSHVITPGDIEKKSNMKPIKTSTTGGSLGLQKESRNFNLAYDNQGIYPDDEEKSEPQSSEETDESIIDKTSEAEASYHVVQRLQNFHGDPHEIVDGLRGEILNTVESKMKMFGINAGEKCINNDNCTSKMKCIDSEKHSLAMKYPDFLKIREWYNKFSSKLAASSMHKVESKRKITFADPEVTAEVEIIKGDSSEGEDLNGHPNENKRNPVFLQSSSSSSISSHRESSGFSMTSTDMELEAIMPQVLPSQNLPVGVGHVRKLPLKSVSAASNSVIEVTLSDVQSESSEERSDYNGPVEDNVQMYDKEQDCDDSEELSSCEISELNSH